MADRVVRQIVVPPSLHSICPIKRVAAYARVSTAKEDQENSLEAQRSYFQTLIQLNLAWENAGLYVDDGISGLGCKERPAFKRMIADALAGRIDLIITKSLSRFARNTVDSIATIRKLKAANVEVYFEKEQMSTFDSKSEFVLTLMSCFAQEESRSISENVAWGHRKKFADGKYYVPYAKFLGYDKGTKDVPLVINPAEAVIVKQIYLMFLSGASICAVAKQLTELGIPTPAHLQTWSATTVLSILTNEKYKGDALLQKKFTVDFLTKKQKVNEGELPRYYVEEGHKAIIPPYLFQLVQDELTLRRSQRYHFSSVKAFAGKIVCSCGRYYGPRISIHTGYDTRSFWRCTNYYNEGKHSGAIREDHLTEKLCRAIHAEFANNTAVIECLAEIIDSLPEERQQSAKQVLTEMLSFERPSMFVHEQTWRFIIRKITVDDNRQPTFFFINGIKQ